MQFVYREYPVRECTEGQPESKLSGQLRCTTLLPSSSNFLKPNIPSPKIGLLTGNYEVSFIYWKLENVSKDVHLIQALCSHWLRMILYLAMLLKDDSKVYLGMNSH